LDADQRPSNNRFSSCRKIKYGRREDTAHDHAPTASTPVPQVRHTGRLLEPHRLRASHRATDPVRSLPYRPWHPHDRAEPLTPGEVVALDVEIWPTSVVVPAGYRLAVTVGGRDFECRM
jgi:predicted acyl esterase